MKASVRFWRIIALFCAVYSLAAAQTSGPVKLQGGSGPVTIVRDRDGVPHIRARSEADALFGLGYAHAQDRLWQLEYQRRLANGQLAEILGPPALPVDSLFRTVGLHRAAATTWSAYHPADREPVAAYVAGINTWLESIHPDKLPVEFVRLGIKPQPWRPQDVLAWTKVLAWSLASNWDHELLRLQITQKLGAEKASQLMPAYTDDGPTILDRGSNQAVLRAPAVPQIDAPAAAALLALQQTISNRFGIGSEGPGSNNWVLSGSRSMTGKPLLAGDPHVGLQSPSISYLAHITTPTLDVIGGTGPGRPDFLAGHNGRIAWSISTSNADIQDLYFEHVNDRNEVEFRGAWEPLRLVTETILVKGAAPVNLQVRISRHGPLISDIVSPAGPALALRWTELDAAEDGGIRGFLGVARATDWMTFRNALRHTALHQNLVYADKAGNIGYQLSSTIPIRAQGDGTAPVPGWSGDYEWSGYVPFNELPRSFNPPQGYIVTANNKIIGDHYPYRISNNYAAPFRAARIIQMLDAKPRHSPRDMEQMQADVLAVHAVELLPLLRSITPANDRARRALAMLRTWDARVTAGPEAAVFEAWYTAIARRLFADELGEDLWRTYANNIYLVGMAVRGSLLDSSPWCDDVTTLNRETCVDIASAAFEDGLAAMAKAQGTDQLESWRWTKVHNARFAHAVFPDLTRSVPNIGDKFTVNVGSTFRWETYDQLHGAVYRQVIDFFNLGASRFMLAPGQSGDPASSHYDDLLPSWQRIDYIPMRFGRWFTNVDQEVSQ